MPFVVGQWYVYSNFKLVSELEQAVGASSLIHFKLVGELEQAVGASSLIHFSFLPSFRCVTMSSC